ncbi:hypothetical protein CDCA_CDCA03G1034 [Cyanidium caldarium]|uniref:ABC transporter domain-containing protein n=1 Tax=Cyanidium caldarium TaxID=2771 RepID=A0AAV9IS84_CYACA|nr:hypothetical protein CDCA_CDCA03G1034 [Cyanidium caldarium]
MRTYTPDPKDRGKLQDELVKESWLLSLAPRRLMGRWASGWVNWRALDALRKQVEREHADFLTDPRYDIENEAHFDGEAYANKVREMQAAMLLRPPTIALGWNDLTVDVPVVYGKLGIETVYTRVRDLALAIPSQVLDVLKWLWLDVIRRGKDGPGTHLEPIVDGATGYVLPGETLLVLGPPGSGTSTFLNVLAQRNLRDYARIRGTVEYNGHDLGTMERNTLPPLQHIVQFVEESDVHVATLSVRQTFMFAAECLIPDFFPFADKVRKDRVTLLIRSLGLTHCQDTIVGNDMMRGVSGGEKKRVTIGEMTLRLSSQIWMLDQWTRGLDAATAMDLQERVTAIARQRHITVISVMQQPSQEIYNSYDKVMLMEAGKILYFGPTKDAERYFYEIGYRRPRKRLLPEFLATIGDPEQSARCIRPGYERRAPRTPAEFAEVYRNSSIAQHYREVVESRSYLTEDQQQAFHSERYVELGKLFQRNSLQKRTRQTATCFKREVRMQLLSPFSLGVRIFRYVVLGIVIGCLFFGLSKDQLSVTVREGLIFLILLIVGVAGFSSITAVAGMLQVVRKQRRAGFYEMPPYFFSQWVLDIPIQFLETFLFLVIVIHMTKLQGGPPFGYAILIVWLVGMAVNILLKAVAYATPYADIALVIGSLLIMLMVLSVGFLATPPNIPDYLIWVYWINPFHYAYEGMMLNEFDGITFTCTPSELQPSGVPQAYQVCPITDGIQYISKQYGFSSSPSYKWKDVAIVIAYFFGFTVIACILLTVVRWRPRPLYKGAREAACSADVETFIESVEREHSVSEHHSMEKGVRE